MSNQLNINETSLDNSRTTSNRKDSLLSASDIKFTYPSNGSAYGRHLWEKAVKGEIKFPFSIGIYKGEISSTGEIILMINSLIEFKYVILYHANIAVNAEQLQ